MSFVDEQRHPNLYGGGLGDDPWENPRTARVLGSQGLSAGFPLYAQDPPPQISNYRLHTREEVISHPSIPTDIPQASYVNPEYGKISAQVTQIPFSPEYDNAVNERYVQYGLGAMILGLFMLA